MKAALLTGIKKMEIRNVPTPSLSNSTDVLIRIKRVGVCGSDIHYFKEGKIGEQQIEFPYIIGHECSGEIVEVGSDVSELSMEDYVAIDPLISCFNCDQCQVGRYHTCRNQRFLGCPGQISGALAEYIVMPQESCLKVNSQITPDQAVLVEPLSIGLYSVELASSIVHNNIGILGVGPIGLSVMLAAELEEPNKIYVTDKLDYRLDMAKLHGADWIGNPDQIDIVGAVQKDNPKGLDVVFECCGQQQALDQAIDLLKPGGTLLIVGIPETERISFNINKLRRKEINIVNVRRQNGCIQKAINLIHSKQIKPDYMVTHHLNLKHIDDAFRLVLEYKDKVVKAIISLDN